MSKKIFFPGLLFSLVLFGVLFGTTTFAKQMVGTAYPMGERSFEASWLIGQQVNTREGDLIGQISSFVIDQANDRVALVVLSGVPWLGLLSGVPGLGTEEVAIPYGCLERTGEYTFDLRFPLMRIGSANNSKDSGLYGLTLSLMASELYGVPRVIDPGWVANIYEHYGQMPYWIRKGEGSLKAMDLYKSTPMIGVRVHSPEGEGDAMVNDFIIDSSNGHIPLLILSDIKGRVDNLVAVPFETMKRTGEGQFALNITEDRLASAPRFHKSEVDNRGYADHVYKFFGLQPYWTEGRYTVGMTPSRWGGEAQDF